MIAVIADDLTGAAELAGLGWHYGLHTEMIYGNAINGNEADLLVVATDTRSVNEQEAVAITTEINAALQQAHLARIFKKVDSVLRGHVLAELRVQLRMFSLKRALLLPANPALGRTISDGEYFINGQPAHLTSFARDPEFPVTSPDVKDMLRAAGDEVKLCRRGDALPETGIIVGECTSEDDIRHWLQLADDQTLLAGGSGFFKILLESLGYRQQEHHDEPYAMNYPALYVCGSTFGKSRALVGKISREGGPVSYMPPDIVKLPSPPDALFDAWANEIVSLLKIHQKAIVGIHDDATPGEAATAAALRSKKAAVIKIVFERTPVRELLIEGGSTAAAIINRLNLHGFSPVKELGPGAIKLKPHGRNDLFLTLKPGSYDWPEGAWNF